MPRRVPIVSTVIVLLAVATMVGLGVWQLGRLGQKEALIARYEQALVMSSNVAWPAPADYEASLFRHAVVDCREVRSFNSVSGRSAKGQSGWSHVARCSRAEGGMADVAIGWSSDPTPPVWEGGEVGGIIAPYGQSVKLIVDRPQAGLQELARPDPSDLPNNHLAYAGQWFFFALTALVIYILAVRRRWRTSGS